MFQLCIIKPFSGGKLGSTVIQIDFPFQLRWSETIEEYGEEQSGAVGTEAESNDLNMKEGEELQVFPNASVDLIPEYRVQNNFGEPWELGFWFGINKINVHSLLN